MKYILLLVILFCGCATHIKECKCICEYEDSMIKYDPGFYYPSLDSAKQLESLIKDSGKVIYPQ